MADKTYVWCTYREWSFKILEGLQDLDGWKAGLIVTTPDCRHDFSRLEKRGIPVLRADPKTDLQKNGAAYAQITSLKPETIFHNGWSWLVPVALLNQCPNVVLHPGKLPKDRGGSPIQNQVRNSETWTYLNLMRMERGLDTGPVYLREKISLDGQADDIWARMTATGLNLSREYLTLLAAGKAQATPQDYDQQPEYHNRVKPEQSIIKPGGPLTAHQIHNIVRAHNETDPNTYVVPARVPLGTHELVVERATLDEKIAVCAEVIELNPPRTYTGDDLARLCSEVNNGRAVFALRDPHGRHVYLTRAWLRAEGK
jgi:methionyl-tRNA formyltransferase